MPWQQFVNAIDRVIRDAPQYLTQIRIGFDVIQQCRADLAVERGRIVLPLSEPAAGRIPPDRVRQLVVRVLSGPDRRPCPATTRLSAQTDRHATTLDSS